MPSPYEEVVEALGFVSERPLGLRVVALESIVGTLDRDREFDRRFRPTSGRVRTQARSLISLSGPWDYALLAEGVEAWGFRAIQECAEQLDRRHTAQPWLEREYQPVVATLCEADLIGRGTETDAYLRIVCDRYRLMRTHRWNEDVLRQVLEGGEGPRRR